MTTSPPRRRWPWVVLGVLGALVLLAAVGLTFLDRIILGRVRAETAELSRRWGRPVEVDGVSTRLVPRLGVRVTGVRVGAAAGEPRPLLELTRAEVRVDLLRALLSRGHDVTIRLAEVQGLRVNVLRLADGTTNAERLARAAGGEAPAAPRQPEKPPADLSFLRVDRATLSDARVAFLDLSRPGARELAIDKIELAVQDLRAGRPLDVALRAAVLSDQPNLEAHLHAAPLPSTLRPTPERLAVKLAPVDLAPLAPFFPASAGFQGGHLEADLTAVLGGAVPGGRGPSALRGGLAARGLRFAGQEGGRPLDVVLDADLEADAAKGDLRIGKLLLTAGPASVTGAGRAEGLAGDAPKVEGLELTVRGLDPQALAAWYPPLRASLGDRVAGPIGLVVRAAGDAAHPALEASADLTPVRLALPGTLTKAAGAPLTANARATFAGGTAHVEARLDLAGVDLRPGGSLAKAPGDRLALALDLERRASGGGQALTVKRLDVLLPAGDAVTAHGTASTGDARGARTVRFDLAAESARLDLDRLLLPADAARPKEKKAPPDPATFAGLSGTVQVQVGELRYSKATFRDVRARLKLDGDDLLVEEARLDGLGGRVSAAGTRTRLAHPQEPSRLVAKLEGVDAGEALALFTPRKLLSGKVSADVDVAGGGADRGALLASLAGTLSGKLFDGAFLGKDLLAGVAGPLAKALPFAAPGKLTEGGKTPLGKELPFSAKLADGALHLTKPLEVATPRAGLSVKGGQVKLDGTLDLPVTVALTPETVSALTGGKAKPTEPIPLTLSLRGPAWSPSLADLSLQPAVEAIVKSAGSAALGKLLGTGSGAPEQVLSGKKAGAEDSARKAADDARQKAEAEAKKRLEGLFGK